MKTGVELITDERARQIAVEGWTPEHDDKNDAGEMCGAATAYILTGHGLGTKCRTFDQAVRECFGSWPKTWLIKWCKPSEDPIRNLVKAGALIAAEIDRLQRQVTP